MTNTNAADPRFARLSASDADSLNTLVRCLSHEGACDAELDAVIFAVVLADDPRVELDARFTVIAEERDRERAIPAGECCPF